MALNKYVERTKWITWKNSIAWDTFFIFILTLSSSTERSKNNNKKRRMKNEDTFYSIWIPFLDLYFTGLFKYNHMIIIIIIRFFLVHDINLMFALYKRNKKKAGRRVNEKCEMFFYTINYFSCLYVYLSATKMHENKI